MAPPTIWQHVRQTLGRAFRETGQALDRLGLKTVSVATTKHDYFDDPVLYEDHFSRHRQQMPLLYAGKPVVHPEVSFIAPCATLIGSVSVDKDSSIWYGAVLRGDECEHAEMYYTDNKTTTSKDLTTTTEDYDDQEEEKGGPWELSEDRHTDRLDRHGGGIFIGRGSNIQDGAIVTARESHTQIGQGVTVGHLAQIHSATVHDYALIGMGSILQPGSVVETESFVAAGAVVLPNQIISSGELWVGNPARKLRDLTPAEREKLHYQSSEYVNVAGMHAHVMELGGNIAQVVPLEDEEEPAMLADSSSDSTTLVKEQEHQAVAEPLSAATSSSGR